MRRTAPFKDRKLRMKEQLISYSSAEPCSPSWKSSVASEPESRLQSAHVVTLSGSLTASKIRHPLSHLRRQLICLEEGKRIRIMIMRTKECKYISIYTTIPLCPISFKPHLF
ncbi:hypothetical protein RF11_13185 [Thelohanellus kitauei]|uniref:Uncharacterized protein n=1 Tax=Thelohanellus kitauei TaxID=669202 RepID=A0A0C2JNI9_THEKT|nr:hypothetical protein RF11_13185 [Thelohanellus kitauei]